jgi:hypothetical protein
MASRIKNCRVCSGNRFEVILDLGNQCLTGVFPRTVGDDPEKEPLELIKCKDCNLVQLAHNFNPKSMYGENYGYRSGLNQSMVTHLREKAFSLNALLNINAKDIVIDIGSNDGTFLSNFLATGAKLIGVDPTAEKFRSYYDESILLIADFFPSKDLDLGSRKAKLISSIAMFYDLPDPVNFAKTIKNHLAENGVWHFEQSYLPEMLKTVSYDTICHEHLEYYTLNVIENILKSAGLEVIDVELNSTNGGSIAVNAAHVGSDHVKSLRLASVREKEIDMRLDLLSSFDEFVKMTSRHRDDLVRALQDLHLLGKKVYGLGASTKGNVLLQYCGITESLVEKIGEVNSEKFGKITPGTHIRIVSEVEMREEKPDVLLVLPWHFKDSIVAREFDFISEGGTLLFPLPALTFVNKDGESSEY